MSNLQGSVDSVRMRYTFVFGGASREIPERSGGGAVDPGSDRPVNIIMREGLGIQTNNAAEYMALNRALQIALDHEYQAFLVRGNSQIVHMQITGQWDVLQNLIDLHNDARNLILQFRSFASQLVTWENNHEADELANQAAENLRAGELQRWYANMD